MASTAAVPFWRSAGMTYITYSNICANLVRNCLKEPYKSEAVSREKVDVNFDIALQRYEMAMSLLLGQRNGVT
ncbi:hypothetical protein R6Q57_019057 [Mikania cordata]